MIKKVLCTILVLSMLLSSIAVTSFAGENPSVTLSVDLAYVETHTIGTKNYKNVVQLDIYLDGLEAGAKINVIEPLKLNFDADKATGGLVNTDGKALTKVTSEATADNSCGKAKQGEIGDGFVSFEITNLTNINNGMCITGTGNKLHLLTGYIQIKDADVINKKAPLDITIDTSAFDVKYRDLDLNKVTAEYDWSFESTNLTFDLREDMSVTFDGDTVTYDGQEHKIEVSGAPEGSTITYTCNGQPFTGAKDVGTYEVTAKVECVGYKPFTVTKTLTINKAELNVLVAAEPKVYDGTATFSPVIGNVNGIVVGDENDVTVVYDENSAVMGGANVGTYTDGEVQLSLDGAKAENYIIDSQSGRDITVVVDPREITAQFASVVNRAYDGTIYFDADVTFEGLVDGDNVVYTATGELKSKAAISHTDAVVKVVLDTEDAITKNYKLTNDFLTDVAVEISKREITASVTARDKEYDGSNVISATAELSGILDGDTVETSVDADVYIKNAATYTNGHAEVSLIGLDADNYVLTTSEFNDLRVTINKKILTITGLAAVNRVSDNTTTVELTDGTLVGIVENDDVTSVIPTEGTVADANPGTGKAVTIPEITLSGADAANYTLVQPTGITVDILSPTPAPVYRPSYSTSGGSTSKPVTPDKTDDKKEEDKEDAKEENKEDNKEEVKEETKVDYTKATATVTLKEKASEIRFISTDEEGKFNPDVKATRNEVVNALNEILNIADATGDCELKDIENSENADIVELFTKANIIAGYDDGTFRGNDSITRAEFVKILTVALGLEIKEHETDKVSDIADHWSKDYVNSFVELGYILGYPDGTFRPDEGISRAEVVIIVNRVIGKDVKNADNADVTISDMDDSHWAYEYIMASVK